MIRDTIFNGCPKSNSEAYAGKEDLAVLHDFCSPALLCSMIIFAIIIIILKIKNFLDKRFLLDKG
jgi:hypothetical protein